MRGTVARLYVSPSFPHAETSNLVTKIGFGEADGGAEEAAFGGGGDVRGPRSRRLKQLQRRRDPSSSVSPGCSSGEEDDSIDDCKYHLLHHIDIVQMRALTSNTGQKLRDIFLNNFSDPPVLDVSAQMSVVSIPN
jgi:hypothetical protein